jgi:hypothetical protein
VEAVGFARDEFDIAVAPLDFAGVDAAFLPHR